MIETELNAKDKSNVAQAFEAMMTTTTDAEDIDGDDDDEIDCPLFMERLPQDFVSNPQLAAIASLLEDEDSAERVGGESILKSTSSPSSTPKRGGGKVARCKSNRDKRRSEPYSTSTTGKKANTTTGDVQLFLKMWKL